MTRREERGFTLAEVLVAVTVMAIVFIVAFTLYDNLQKSFKMSENAANEQQNTRVAFDKMVADVRMAGFNHNPDGDPNRPDEQIEGAWSNAITVRGDYDFEDSVARLTPETTLGGAGMPFRAVSTGNDEIVTYALAKPSGTGGTSITFVADVVGVPRNGTQETVTVANVDLAQGTPPYTLYRFIVSPNSTTVIRQPVADNIKSMSFTYYDGTGAVLTPPGGDEDPNTIAERTRITKVGINVVGMTEDPDLAYIDPTDPNATTQHYRKYTLASDVTPRNLGLKGVVDIDLDDPNAPSNFTACQGHCEGTYLKWQSGGDPDVFSYTVSWGTSATNLTNVISVSDLHHYISNITGAHYYAVRAIDMVGNQSNNVILGPSTPTNTTTPAQVAGAACSGDAGGVLAAVKNEINVAWSPLSGNTTNLGCDEPPYPIRDLKGYRIYKGATALFDPNNAAQVLQTWDPNAVPANTNTIADANVVNCRQYFYKVRGEDLCGVKGAVSAVADGASTTNVPPAAPAAVDAVDMGLGLQTVTWTAVTQNTDPLPATIMIDKYKVYRAAVRTGDDPNLASYGVVFNGQVSNPAAPSFQDANVPNLTGGYSYYYRISALDDCINNESALSLPDEADKCNYGGTVSMSIVPGGNPITGSQTITLTSSGPPTISSRLIITDSSTGAVVFIQTDNVPPYTYTWSTAGLTPGGSYTITGYMTNNNGCSESVTTSRSISAAIACCISSNTPTITPTTGSLKNNELFFDIVNNCGNDVVIEAMAIEFTNNSGQNAQMSGFEFNVLGSLLPSRNFGFSPALSPVVQLDFSVPPLSPQLDLLAGHNTLNPLRVRYGFTKPMLNKAGATYVGESIETEFRFGVKNMAGVGRCNITIVTNPLSLVGCDPASDPNCTL